MENLASGELVLLIIVDLAIALIIGNWGSQKTTGFWPAFLVSLILTPIVGLFVVGFSASKPKMVHRYQNPYEEAKREEFKGNFLIAIDKYQDALYYLTNDYTNISGTWKTKRDDLMVIIIGKIETLKSKIPSNVSV